MMSFAAMSDAVLAAATPTPAESPGVASQWELGTGLFWVVVVALLLYVLYWRLR